MAMQQCKLHLSMSLDKAPATTLCLLRAPRKPTRKLLHKLRHAAHARLLASRLLLPLILGRVHCRHFRNNSCSLWAIAQVAPSEAQGKQECMRVTRSAAVSQAAMPSLQQPNTLLTMTQGTWTTLPIPSHTCNHHAHTHTQGHTPVASRPRWPQSSAEAPPLDQGCARTAAGMPPTALTSGCNCRGAG